MRTLKFNVTSQIIKRDPQSSFKDIVAGTSNYYQAAFVMDESWYGYSCIAQFRGGDEISYQPIIKGKCKIPDNVLHYNSFFVSVIGKKGEIRLTTNEIQIFQIGGKQWRN